MTLQRTDKKRNAIAKPIAERIAARMRARNHAFEKQHPDSPKAPYKLDENVLQRFTSCIAGIIKYKEIASNPDPSSSQGLPGSVMTWNSQSGWTTHIKNQCSFVDFPEKFKWDEYVPYGTYIEFGKIPLLHLEQQSTRNFDSHWKGLKYRTFDASMYCLYEESKQLAALDTNPSIRSVSHDVLTKISEISGQRQEKADDNIAAN